MDVVVYGWYEYCGEFFGGCVYSRGIFSCVGEFDVVMCGGRFDRVGTYVNIMYFSL